jgi:hypothetical protein
MTRVETKMEALTNGQKDIIARLDNHDAATASLDRKLDMIIANQAANSGKTAAAIESVKEDIARMQPDVQTIADVKKFGPWVKRGALALAGLVTAIVTIKGWIILNMGWIVGIPPRP